MSGFNLNGFIEPSNFYHYTALAENLCMDPELFLEHYLISRRMRYKRDGNQYFILGQWAIDCLLAGGVTDPIPHDNSAAVFHSDGSVAREFLNRKQLAKVIGVSASTIDNWRSQGMPSHGSGRTVRFDLPQVRAWMSKRKGK